MITYRKAAADDIRSALDLALRLFITFHTPECEQQAMNSCFTARFKDESYHDDFESKNRMWTAHTIVKV